MPVLLTDWSNLVRSFCPFVLQFWAKEIDIQLLTYWRGEQTTWHHRFDCFSAVNEIPTKTITTSPMPFFSNVNFSPCSSSFSDPLRLSQKLFWQSTNTMDPGEPKDPMITGHHSFMSRSSRTCLFLLHSRAYSNSTMLLIKTLNGVALLPSSCVLRE